MAAIAGTIILGAAIIFWHLGRRRRQRAKSEASVTTEDGMPEMEGDQTHGIRRWFLNGTSRKELPVKERRLELDSKTVDIVPGRPVELDASEVSRHETAGADPTGSNEVEETRFDDGGEQNAQVHANYSDGSVPGTEEPRTVQAEPTDIHRTR